LVLAIPNDGLTTTDCKESIMAKATYSADSAFLPPSPLLPEVRLDLVEATCPRVPKPGLAPASTDAIGAFPTPLTA
jgi:hypothetical protein